VLEHAPQHTLVCSVIGDVSNDEVIVCTKALARSGMKIADVPTATS
jgi:hypothetical protein